VKKSIVDIFALLGLRLSSLGGDVSSREIVRRAVEANPWFSESEIIRAAKALVDGMLSRETLSAWLADYPALPVSQPRNVLIVMAGNIPFVGFQDLLCVLVAGHRAVVKPSSKDSVLMWWIIEQLREISPDIPISHFVEEEHPDALVAMGGDDAVGALGRQYGTIPTLLRGSRSSVAVLAGCEPPEQLTGLADDILSYSGLGCRNVSLVFVPDDLDIGALVNTLGTYHHPINPKYANNCRQIKAILYMNGAEFTDCGICVLCEEWNFPADISRINYARYSTAEDVSRWLTAHDGEIQCVVGTIDHPRAVGFGEAQYPTLFDYPDGRDTMQFLSSI
jgi:hypothetical protein